jgi:clan AA aspartic protease
MQTSEFGSTAMDIISTEVRLSNFSHPELETITAKVLVDTGAIDLVIPEHVAIQLHLIDLQPREVHLADGGRKLVRYVGPVKIETMGRDCVTAAAVMGDQVLLGAIPMEAMDLVVEPRTQRVRPNPESPNIPMFLAK